ncbi:MAG: hypothetical protein P1V20_08505 [Verrucomicrobiales bacterium]|nr:hypothetical protein [Verrucomicrobiales bacterium]
MRNVSGLETVFRDYSPKGAKFYYIYKALAHPQKDGFVQPLTIEERVAHLKIADSRFDTDWTWLADSMNNEIKEAFGNRNNSEFVIDPNGKIVSARSWSDEEALREDLEKYIGKIDKRTLVTDLGKDMSYTPKTTSAAVSLPPVPSPPDARTVTVSALESDQPYYIKLRADAGSQLLKTGTGQLKLAFHIDPIHRVHWNNLAPPLQYHINSPGSYSPVKATAAKVEPESDRSPREFAVEVSSAGLSDPIEIEVHYYACHDDEEWCKAITQTFTVLLKEDKHAGKVQEKGRGKGRPSERKGRPRMSPETALSRMDLNKDGVINTDESRGPFVERFDQIDKDHDKIITLEELKTYFANRKR